MKKCVRKKTDTRKEEWMKNFSSKLKQRMEYLEMSQNRLAKMAGISQFAIWTYVTCRNVPTAYHLSKLAEALITTPNDLVSFD